LFDDKKERERALFKLKIKIMKKLLLLLFLNASLSYSQTDFVNNQIVVSNLSMDTVYILDDEMGRMIYSTWEYNPYHNGKKVAIFLVKDLAPYREMYERLANIRRKN